MSDDHELETFRKKVNELERRLAYRNSWILLFFLLNGLLLGAISSCARRDSDTIEARQIILKDPSGHRLAVLGVANNWGGLESKDYYPGIVFQDAKGERTMSLFGTGLSMRYGDEHSELNFIGLEIASKDSRILLNPGLFSFAAKHGAATLTPHTTGMDFTIQSESDNEFGVVTNAEAVSSYAASPNWEVDVGADKTGTQIARGRKQKLP